MAFASLTVDLTAKMAKFEDSMNRATKSVDHLNSRTSAVASGLKTAFTGAAVLGLAAFAKSGIDAADALGKLSARTGVTVKDLASLQLAADSADTSLDDVGKAMLRLKVSQGDAATGNKALGESLARLGITSKDPKEQLFQLADAVKNGGDSAVVASDLNKVLGRSYANLIPLLQQGGDALRESAMASEDFADAMARLSPNAERFNDQLDAMKQNAAGFAASMIGAVMPSLNQYIGALQEIIDKGTLLDKIKFFTVGYINADVADKVTDYATRTAQLREELARLQKTGGDTTEVIARLNKLYAGKVEEIQRPPRRDSKVATDKPTKSKSGRKSDPLASLLGQTDIVKMQEFDKTVALLNQRFDNGRKNTELYGQAMTKLVETTFSANFDEFNKQQAELADIERDVAAHLKATNDEIYAQEQAWMDAGKALEDEMRTPLENANLEFGRLNDLLDRGAISWETYTRAVLKTQDAIEQTPDKLEEMDVFAKKAAENIQQSFADFLFNPFDKGLDGMLKSFGVMIQRMIADAVAADLAKSLFGDLTKGGSGDGVAGGLLKTVGSWIGYADGGIHANGMSVALPRFAGGGVSNTAAIFAEAGPEAAVPLPDGRSIPVTMKGGGGNTYVVNVNGSNNAPDVRRAAGQGMREALGMMNGAKRYA